MGKGLCSVSWGFLGLLATQIVVSLNLVLFLSVGSCPCSRAGLTLPMDLQRVKTRTLVEGKAMDFLLWLLVARAEVGSQG